MKGGDNLESIGSRIKKLREERNMTQDDLAKIASVTRQTIFKYENELITNIPSDKIEKIAAALNVGPNVLMGWDIPRLGCLLGYIAKNGNETDERFLELYVNLTNESKIALTAIAQQLKKE